MGLGFLGGLGVYRLLWSIEVGTIADWLHRQPLGCTDDRAEVESGQAVAAADWMLWLVPRCSLRASWRQFRSFRSHMPRSRRPST